MSVVVDLGCFSHEGEQDASVAKLIDRFHPEVLYGFDPWPSQGAMSVMVGETRVAIEPRAVWTHSGTIRLSRGQRGYDSTVLPSNEKWSAESSQMVPCVDFSAWLTGIAGRYGSAIVVKMDIEGAEVPVLERMLADGSDHHVSLLLVEWHDRLFGEDYAARRKEVVAALSCAIEEWD